MSGKEIEPLGIMALSSNNVPPDRWPELVKIWRDPDPPGEWQTFIEPLATTVMLRDTDEVLADASRYLKRHPQSVRQWLSTIVGSLNNILIGNQAYDARPSTHFKQDLRQVVNTFGIAHIDRALRGGIWDAALVMFGGISNHGKSTLAYTLAAKCVEREIRCAFVTTETLASEVTVGVLRILADLADAYVRSKDARCLPYLEKLDRYLAIYDYHYADTRSLDRLLYWEQPQVLLYDFIKAPENADSRTPEQQLIANLGEGLRMLGNDHRCTIIAFGQFSAATADQFMRKHDLRGQITMFGSSRLYHCADQVIIMKRHWSLPDMGFFKVKKDRLPTAYIPENLFDWEFTLRHDRRTRGFYQLENNAADL